MSAVSWASANGPAVDAASPFLCGFLGQRLLRLPQFCLEESGGGLRDLFSFPLGAGLAAALAGNILLPFVSGLGGQGGVLLSISPLSSVLYEVVRRLAAVFGRFCNPPHFPDPLGACWALQGNMSDCSDDSVVGVVLATYQQGALASTSQAVPVDIEGLLPPPLHVLLSGADGLFRY